MFEHKEDCPFKDFSESLTARDPNGPDSQLKIDETGISFEENIYTVNDKDYIIHFNFCPCCGVAKSE